MRVDYEWLGGLDKYGHVVKLNDRSWGILRKEENTPIEKAYCRQCHRESAKIMYPIWKNGKEAYALQCPTCGNEYSMYVYKFRQMYIGHTTPNGGRINPTHGTKSIFQAMDRKAREGWNNIPKNTEHHLVDELHLMTHEEYQSMHEKRRKQEAKNRREYEQRMMEYLEKEDEKRMKEESLTRKELIEKGIIKYKKGIGLVNTQTGEIIKL